MTTLATTRAWGRKELTEIRRTWRIYVLPTIFGFFAITGPILAKFTPELVAAVAGGQVAGLVLPEATVADAYGQWIKNMGQIGLFVILIGYGGIVSAERNSGTATLILTKPVSRTAFVLTKAVVHAGFIAAVTVVGTALTWAVTRIVFGQAPAGPIWTASGVWLALALFYFAGVVLFSVLLKSAAGAAGLGIGLFAIVTAAGLWAPLAHYSPAGLLSAAGTLAADHPTDSLVVPLLVTAALAAAALAAAAWGFSRQDL